MVLRIKMKIIYLSYHECNNTLTSYQIVWGVSTFSNATINIKGIFSWGDVYEWISSSYKLRDASSLSITKKYKQK